MIVSQAEIDRIRGWRSKERTLRLPVNRGPLGERKRCPMREGGTYMLKPRPEYARWVRQAEQLPREQGVLWLIDRCLQPGRTVTITVLSPPCLDGDEWAVVFMVGRHEVLDRDVYLAERGDYTLSRANAARGEPPVLMPLEKDLEKARRKALEDRFAPNLAAADGLQDAAGAFEKSMMQMKARNRLRLIEKETLKLTQEVSAEAAATLRTSDRVQRQPAAAGEGDPRPSDLGVVSLDPAA